MKPTTKDSYIQSIDRVVGYLNQRVEVIPTLQQLADIAGISPFHFHRVYRAITGETPSGTLRRLRLARAAAMLKQTQKPITEIAFDVGYDSSQAFSKAFREATGFSASGLRQEPQRLEAVIKGLSSPPEQATGKTLEVKLVSVDPFKVIASRHVGPHKGLFKVFGALIRWAEETGRAKAFRGIYGIPIDDPRGVSEEECRFDCCFDFGPDVQPDETHRDVLLGGGLYAVTRHVGPYEGLEEKYDFLYGPWLSSSGYVLSENASYNHYQADPDTSPPEEWETDIYLPIER